MNRAGAGHGNGKKGRKARSLFSLPLGCGCKDVKSVSVPVSSKRDNTLFSSTSTSISICSWEEHEAESTPRFSDLLRELNELEQSVKEWNALPPLPLPLPLPSFSPDTSSKGSIAVVKESADPLDDFKKSMVQMIAENEIASRDEMEELLQRFLFLNSLQNHHIIVQAFTELWEELGFLFSRVDEV